MPNPVIVNDHYHHFNLSRRSLKKIHKQATMFNLKSSTPLASSMLLVATIMSLPSISSISLASQEFTIITQDGQANADRFQSLQSLQLQHHLIHHQQQPSSSQSQQQQQQQQSGSIAANFDVSNYRNIRETIGAHPLLREFANLCEADGVKEIISLDRQPLTVFAPIDRALGDMIAKSKSSSKINLIELAKHHIAHGLIAPDENTKFPLQFSTYSELSPLYLNQVRSNQQQQQIFVNNAKILATYLIPIESDSFQTLHIIDSVVEFAYVNRKSQLKSLNGQSSRVTTKKSKFSIDDLLVGGRDSDLGTMEFSERFGDYQTNLPNVDLYHARAFKGFQRITPLTRDNLKLDRLAYSMKQFQLLRGRLHSINESTSLNTYFLPINSKDLDKLLYSDNLINLTPLVYEAFVVPDQVLFTRTMSLRKAHETLFNRDSSSQRVTLSLAKSLVGSHELETDSNESLSKKLLSSPLLLQAKCENIKQNEKLPFRAGVTSSEILLANIPLSNGVLHLIKRPILVTSESNLLDYINDDDNALSELLNSIGSRTTSFENFNGNSNVLSEQPTTSINNFDSSWGGNSLSKFRDLLVKEREILSTLSIQLPQQNKTILAPTDEAFSKLKYTLRALLNNEELLIPKHWDSSFKQEIIERIARRHIISQQSISSDQILDLGTLQAFSENGRLLSFTGSQSGNDEKQEFAVESDSSKALLIHHDLLGSNGVLHIIDRVLGEEQETIYSLLELLVLKFAHLQEDYSILRDLNQIILNNLKQINSESSTNQISAELNSNSNNELEQHSSSTTNKQSQSELLIIAKSIGQFLDELGNQKRQLLSTSVNISFQLGSLTSRAEGLEDWNEKFKRESASFTYFVPSDLAWLRLQQTQPQLYKPLMYFLMMADGSEIASNSNSNSNNPSQAESQSVTSVDHHPSSSASPLRRSSSSLMPSQSSHRLHKIFERHLMDRRISRKDLQTMDSLATMGATLRLVEPSQQHLTADGSQPSTFAALHSIVTGTNLMSSSSSSSSSSSNVDNSLSKLKTLKFSARGYQESTFANIIQANSTSNGFVYIIDNVLISPEDCDYITQTQQSPAINSSMSSILGAHNSAILDFIHGLLAPSPFNMSAHSILALCATLIMAIAILLILALVLLIRKQRRQKNCHQQLESGLTSSSSANSTGSTSTTKSL